MKRLFASTIVFLVLSIPNLSFASDTYNVFGVQLPVVKAQVGNQVKGGKVEKDFTGFYTSPKTSDATPKTITSDQISDDGNDYIIVFGVKIPLTPST